LKNLVDKIVEIEISEIVSYEFPENELFGLKIFEDNVKYEFLLKKSTTSDKLICFGAKGGVERDKRELPDFPRFSWHNSFKESLIYPADPTFYINEEIKTGWYIGNEENWYLEKIAEIISKIKENFRIKNENILFYGTSVGGFSSLMMATLFKKSTALVGNPQIIVSNHFTKPYENIKKYCFNGLDEETIFKKYGHRLNVVELFKRENYVPHIIYLVNAQSKRDLYKQCLPFIGDLGKLPNFNDNDVEIIIYHDIDGHVARVSRKVAIPLIKLVLKRKIYNYNENVSNINNETLLFRYKEQQRIIDEYRSKKLIKLMDKINNIIMKVKNKL